MMRRAALWVGVGLFNAAPLLAWVVDAIGGRQVVAISPHAAEAVEVNRLLWRRGESVAELYGVPSQHLVRVIFPNRSRIVVPEEDPSLVLLRVDKQAGENPLQARTVWFAAKVCVILGAVLAAIAGVLSRRRHR